MYYEIYVCVFVRKTDSKCKKMIEIHTTLKMCSWAFLLSLPSPKTNLQHSLYSSMKNMFLLVPYHVVMATIFDSFNFIYMKSVKCHGCQRLVPADCMHNLQQQNGSKHF